MNFDLIENILAPIQGHRSHKVRGSSRGPFVKWYERSYLDNKAVAAMYGIVNKAIKGLICSKYGDEAWLNIASKCALGGDGFVSNEIYHDDVTYQLVQVASEELNVPVVDILRSFGKYWLTDTGMENYGELLKSGGSNVKEFLVNLPNFHGHIILIFPKLKPPQFRVSEVSDESLLLHYCSDRQGLTDFVYGLILGVGEVYDTDVQIELIESRESGSREDTFKVIW